MRIYESRRGDGEQVIGPNSNVKQTAEGSKPRMLAVSLSLAMGIKKLGDGMCVVWKKEKMTI